MSTSLVKGRKGVLMEFTATGEIKMEGQNFTKSDGTSCKKLSDALNKALGGEVISETLKPEYAEVGAVKVKA